MEEKCQTSMEVLIKLLLIKEILFVRDGFAALVLFEGGEMLLDVNFIMCCSSSKNVIIGRVYRTGAMKSCIN